MMMAATELSLITMGVKGGGKDLHKLFGTNAGILCQQSFSVPCFFSPTVSATSRSHFSTCALNRRTTYSLRRGGSDVEFTGAVCTIGSYPIKGIWGCQVNPAISNLPSSVDLGCFFLLVGLILWKKARGRKIKTLVKLLLMDICICLAKFAAKGNKMAAFLVTLFDKAGKVYKVLGHLLSIFSRLP